MLYSCRERRNGPDWLYAMTTTTFTQNMHEKKLTNKTIVWKLTNLQQRFLRGFCFVYLL